MAGPDGDAELDDLDDVTGDTGTSLLEPSFDISPDGSLLVSTWHRVVPGATGDDLVLITRATHGRRHLTNGHGWYADPVFSPDGRTIAATRTTDGVQGRGPDHEPRAHRRRGRLGAGRGRRPRPLAAGADLDVQLASVIFTADDLGGISIYRLDLADERVTRLTAGGSYHDVSVTPDGETLYALRSDPDRPWHVVRLDARTADQTPTELPSPASPESLLPPRGVVERLTATAEDGTEIGSWLLRPASASADDPAPLIVFVHGGPLGSWAGWSWRWNANPLVERGYAVLMPDPAISVGYGQTMIDRGWGRWGERPYTDVIAAVDGALQRPDLDASRTGLMGGSFGGYMANWVAGHTDRFRAIVTHASLWGLRAFHGTTDDGVGWEQELGDPYMDPSRYVEHSPDGEVGAITTPILVIHGELDARVPISEALRLWTDLWRHDVPAKFLYFPDEGHWVLKPQNTRLWYETVLAFLDQHVLGRDWVRPPLV